MDILRFLPLAYLSWFVGHLANLPLPQPLAKLSIIIFSRIYGIDTSLATRPLESFRSIGDFFTRDLRPELRPISAEVVFPVDGTLRNRGRLSPGMPISQVKGKDYSLEKLLGGDQLASRFVEGYLWNMYLSPRDAHHIYAPVAGQIVRTVHIPGALWPVNDWALNSVDELFAVNERVVTFIESNLGLVAVVMIGATNVGKISLAYEPLETNTRPWSRKEVRVIDHATPIAVKCGSKLATFKMGSSVILLSEKPLGEERKESLPISVQYGAALTVSSDSN